MLLFPSTDLSNSQMKLVSHIRKNHAYQHLKSTAVVFSPVIWDCNSFGFLMANAGNSWEVCKGSGGHKGEKLPCGISVIGNFLESISRHHSIPRTSPLWLVPQLLSCSWTLKSSWAASHEPSAWWYPNWNETACYREWAAGFMEVQLIQPKWLCEMPNSGDQMPSDWRGWALKHSLGLTA